jgi:hypothetical protein
LAPVYTGTNAISKNLDGYGTPPIDWERVRDILASEITQAPVADDDQPFLIIEQE